MGTRKRKLKAKRGGRDYRISVRTVRRDTPDARKLARAVIELAMAQAEADAQRQHDAASVPSTGEADEKGKRR